MKKLFVIFALLLTSNLLGQSPQYFSSGNFNSPNDWDQGDAAAMGSSLGGSFIHTTISNGLVIDIFVFTALYQVAQNMNPTVVQILKFP